MVGELSGTLVYPGGSVGAEHSGRLTRYEKLAVRDEAFVKPAMIQRLLRLI